VLAAAAVSAFTLVRRSRTRAQEEPVLADEEEPLALATV